MGAETSELVEQKGGFSREGMSDVGPLLEGDVRFPASVDVGGFLGEWAMIFVVFADADEDRFSPKGASFGRMSIAPEASGSQDDQTGQIVEQRFAEKRRRVASLTESSQDDVFPVDVNERFDASEIGAEVNDFLFEERRFRRPFPQ